MKLSDSVDNTEILWEQDVKGEVLRFELIPVAEGVMRAQFGTNKPGGAIKGAMKGISNNPFLTGMVASMATDALKKYHSNKRLTTRFYAKSQPDRKLYTKVVADLMATGHYKKVRQRMVDGGIMWELQRKSV